jgi:hypothetical protein
MSITYLLTCSVHFNKINETVYLIIMIILFKFVSFILYQIGMLARVFYVDFICFKTFFFYIDIVTFSGSKYLSLSLSLSLSLIHKSQKLDLAT